VKKHLGTIDTSLAVYDKILSKQKYLAGNEISLADLFHIPHAQKAWEYGFGDVVGKYPHVSKWLEGLKALESWKKASST
jgi:glutathione S-transferase